TRGCYSSAPGVVDVVGNSTYITAPMERQLLHNLVAVPRGRLQLDLQRINASGKFTRTRKCLPQSAVIGHSIAQQSTLCDKRSLRVALEEHVGLGFVLSVAMPRE